MSVSAIPSIQAPDRSGTPRQPDSPERVREAARQFEGLLIQQILRSMRESGAGWLGGGEDRTGECATDFAEQQFAEALSARGGLGLANLICQGLQQTQPE